MSEIHQVGFVDSGECITEKPTVIHSLCGTCECGSAVEISSKKTSQQNSELTIETLDKLINSLESRLTFEIKSLIDGGTE